MAYRDGRQIPVLRNIGYPGFIWLLLWLFIWSIFIYYIFREYMAPPKHPRPKHKNALSHTFKIFLNNSDGIFRELRLRAFTEYWYLSYLKKVVHLRYVAFSPVGMHCFCTWSTVIWGLSQNIINFFRKSIFYRVFRSFVRNAGSKNNHGWPYIRRMGDIYNSG